MSTKLRRLALQEPDVLAFIAAHQRLWIHTAGTGLRELARVWQRANERFAAARSSRISQRVDSTPGFRDSAFCTPCSPLP